MLLTGIIIFILILSLYSGARRGLVLQLVLTIGYAASFWLALNYYQLVSDYAEMFIPYPTPQSASENPFVLYGMEYLFELDSLFYNGVSFVFLLFAGWLATRIVGGLFQALADLPILNTVNAIGGAVVNFFVHYIGVFLLLLVLSTIPLSIIQEQFEESVLARSMVTTTPELSQQFFDWWFEEEVQE